MKKSTKNKKAFSKLSFIFVFFLLVVSQPVYGQYIGCYKDKPDRDLSHQAGQYRDITPEGCISICGKQGYTYAGTQNGNQCWCGNSYGKWGKAANCTRSCNGDSRKTCGGPWANSVYAVSGAGQQPSKSQQQYKQPSQTQISTGQFLGCYKDGTSRDLPTQVSVGGKLSTEKCLSACGKRGYMYAGTQNGNQCWCGNRYGKLGSANNCNRKCEGNSSQTCGGPWANSVYAASGAGQQASQAGAGQQQTQGWSQQPSSQTSGSQIVFNNWNKSGCSMTGTANFNLNNPAQVTKLQSWYNWQGSQSTVQYRLYQNQQILYQNVLRKGSCDPYQRAWCQAIDTLNLQLQPGNYTVMVRIPRICQNPQSSNNGFIEVHGNSSSW
ncbi:MAG: WSC domain-containing protein [SAR324 cluster bacterium]|nr:WSC domain-containing protein [SAR324 cluster bacterium]